MDNYDHRGRAPKFGSDNLVAIFEISTIKYVMGFKLHTMVMSGLILWLVR